MHSRPRFTPQVLFGLIVIVVGVLFTLDNLNVLDAGEYLRYWPAGLVAIGALKLWQARQQGYGWFGGLFFVVLGTWMLLARVVYIRIDISQVWPLAFVLLGGLLVWRGFRSGGRSAAGMDSNAHMSALAVMAGIARGNNSPAFKGADLTAVMGGCEIDLRQASIAPGEEAVIDVFAFWGGIDIRVPEDWTVVSRVTPLMGGLEDKTRPSQAASGKRLQVRGVAIMGGIVIKN
jgi:predicted membrane protein